MNNSQWNVTSQDGQDGFNALELSNAPVPELGASQVLVKRKQPLKLWSCIIRDAKFNLVQAASLNYRDLIIPLGKYPFKTSPNVIPGSDGAGTVIAVGSQVSRFKPGDKAAGSGLGGAIDGTLRSVRAFNEQGLSASAQEIGLSHNLVTAGQWVLTQGSGGVSIFALQFARAAGARVIATTGSDAKSSKGNPEWGAEARKVTGAVGVDHIAEVIGPKSMAQGLKAIKIGGVISITGFVDGEAEVQPGFFDCLMNLCTARGLMVGSRAQVEEMCRAIETNPKILQPVVNKKRLKLEDVKEAYEYQWSGKHVGKVCIEIA
ncbi:hypothetical protein MY4824_008303 [Beauveria thailandica]